MKLHTLKKSAVLVALILFNPIALAQMGERSIEVEVSSRGSEARSEAFQKAIDQVSKEMAERRLGVEFLNENLKRFENDVVAKSDKYILSIKGGATQATDSGTRMQVILNVSQDAFEATLRQSGLMQLSRQNLKAVLLLEEKDKALKEGPWWSQVEAHELSKPVQNLMTKLAQDLKRRGIDIVLQKKVFLEIPSELKKSNLNRSDLIQIGRQHQASLVLFGLVESKGSSFIYHGQWIQVPAERMLSEVQGEAKDVAQTSEKLIEPVLKAQTLGTLNTRPFVLRVRGSLSPKELKSFQDELSSKVRDIRSLKERLMARGDFSFEAESPQAPAALVDTIQGLSFKDFQLKASLDGEDQILLSVKRR